MRRREEEEEGGRRAEEERERSVRLFERVGMGMEGATTTAATAKGKGDEGSDHRTVSSTQPSDDTRGTKRKFALSEPTLLATAQADRLTARAALDAEEAAKPTLPSFWVPSLTPSTHKPSAASVSIKQTPLCPGSVTERDAHPLSLKALVDIKFSYASKKEGDKDQPICLACTKPLSNTLRATLATACGHVLCKPCGGKFLTKNEHSDPHAVMPEEEEEKVRCYVCEADLSGGGDQKGKKKKKKRKGEKDGEDAVGLVELRSEGTGFAGGGRNMARREGVAFQC